MSSPLIASIYTFAVVFAFLAALVIGFRFSMRLGGRSQPDSARRALGSIESEALQDAGKTWPRKQMLVPLAASPPPLDAPEYLRAADEVFNSHSPYSITPLRRDGGEC